MNSPAAAPRHVKLYVLCQTAGWVAWTLAYVGLGRLQRSLTANEIWISIDVNLIGWLLTHLYRAFINTRGWKQLPWPELLWRIIGASIALGIVWTFAAWPLYLYCYTGRLPANLTMTTLLVYSAFNGTFLVFVWSTFYFGYHIYDRYRRSEVERAQLAATVKEAELRALKSQINPHFIFNSLNSLRALIDEDPARARQAVTQLANLLRYSLQSAQAETVAFEDELRVVNDYLALEQVRHEERLRVRLDVAPDTLGLAVPPLLLQTLVENAVKYGISTRPEGGEIVVEARCENGQLRLRVTNPGVLAPANSATQKSGSTGLGLKNAAERLRLFFGDRASLQLRVENASLVVAEVSLPVQMTRA